MKIYEVIRLIPKRDDSYQEVQCYYAADHIKQVIEKLNIDLMDEAMEVLSIACKAPSIVIIPSEESR